MTLILNVATQGFVVHASDRLLTKRVGGKFRVHSDVENKSLIVAASDAICIIGYTGAAYIGDLTTDEWIARTITEIDFAEKFMMGHYRSRGLRLNALLWRLETAVSKLVLPGSANYLGISISGVRQRRGYVRSFIREIERNRGVVRGSGYMRHPRSHGFHGLSQIGDEMPADKLRQIIGSELEKHGITLEGFREGMVKAIRDRTAISKLVGDEIMAVTIARTADCWDVVWTFNSPRIRLAAVVDATGATRHIFQSSFSPWIITPSSVSMPSVGNGHFEHLTGNVKIRCGNEASQTPGNGLQLAVSSHDRAPKG